jgi:myo-inositol-1(or 4)-monophosphatase
LISVGIPHRGRGDHARFLAEIAALMAQVGGVRRTGSAAIDMAWVASGRFDGYIERGLGIWDLAAGTLLVREAGGLLSDTGGRPTVLETGSVVAANSTIHRALLAALGACGAPAADGPRPA